MTLAARSQGWRLASRLWPFHHRDEVATVIDLGSHKIACAILLRTGGAMHSRHAGPRFKIIGSSVLRSTGFSGGRIVNMAAAETCVRRAVAKAEAEAGAIAGEVAVTGAFAGLGAEIFDVAIQGEEAVCRHETASIHAATDDHCLSRERQLLHLFMAPRAAPKVSAPEDSGREDSEGVCRGTGAFEISAVSMPRRGVRQLKACLKRSLLRPGAIIAGPIAASLAVCHAEERQRGILIVDIGAQATGSVLFLGGLAVFAETVPIGGRQITDALAKAFHLRKFDAEGLKAKHVTVFDGLQADIDLPYANGDTGEPVSKFAAAHVARLEMLALFAAVNEGLSGSGYPLPSMGAVLTGGGSLLPGVRELASRSLRCPVRIGEPARNDAMDADGTLSALIGACHYASGHMPAMEIDASPGPHVASNGYASRIGQWLREGFE